MNRYTFKAKRKDGTKYDGKWVFGYYHQLNGYGKIIDCIIEFNRGTSTPIDIETLCQCTGLKDIDGKDIFENDMLDIFETDKEHKHLISNNCTVDYDIKYFKHFIHCNNNEYYSVTDLQQLNSFKETIKFKIIGNKFDKEED